VIKNVSNATVFLNQYKIMEDLAKVMFTNSEPSSVIFNLSNHPNFRHFKSEIDYCREVRNLLTHKPLINSKYAIEPSDEMIHILNSIIDKLEDPPKALMYATPLSRLLTAKLDDFVLPLIKKMKIQNFTHVPILKDGFVIGVFSESTVFDYLADHTKMEIPHDQKVNDYLSYMDLNNHRNETFVFVPRGILTGEAEALFNDGKINKRVEMLFVTENGKFNEKLIAIISPWDLMDKT